MGLGATTLVAMRPNRPREAATPRDPQATTRRRRQGPAVVEHPRPSRPRWVKATRGILVGVVLVAVILLLARGFGPGGHGAGRSGGAAEGAFVVEASEYQFQPSTIELDAGEFEIALSNVGRVEHDFLIEGVDDPGAPHQNHAPPGQTSSGTYDLEPGSYTFYCSVPGHRQSGMEGTLVVKDGPHDPSNWGHG